MPSLFVIRGADQGVRFQLERDKIGVGRDASNLLQLHDQEVSRHHAELRQSEQGYLLVDLQSSNGTFVNGRRVDQRTLATGDRLELGGSLLLYTGPAEEQDDLAQRVSIVSEPDAGDNSRIVHSVSQKEGSRMFSFGPEGGESPWLARARSNLQVMYRTALAVSHTLDIDQLLKSIMDLIFEWVEADRGCILIAHPVTRKLEPQVYKNRRPRPDDRIVVTRTILDYVVEHNEGVLTSNAREDTRWNPSASILQLGIREAICVPMQGRYDVVGVICIDTTTTPQRMIERAGAGNKFTEEHLKLMIAIAHQAALAIEDTRYYSAMVQAERLAAVGQTIATLSHHIKNILQGIRGGSFLIKDGLARHDEGMVTKGWEFVERNQERISNLVMDMLTFSKEREPELAPADLNQVGSDVVELMRARATERNVALEYHPAAEMPTCVFDAEGLHRAVLNVMTNAIDACESREEGRVEVRTESDHENGQLRVLVADNGIGIAAEDLENIFTLFMSRKSSRGTGLGLAVSQKILNEHGGRIRVESEPGRGSCFILEWPAVAPESVSSTEAGQVAK